MTDKSKNQQHDLIKNKYSKYFQTLDTPSVILDTDRKVVWKNDSAKMLKVFLRNGATIDKILDKEHRKSLRKMLPGDTIHMIFELDEPTQGFVKRHDDCYVLRISRFNGSAIKILDNIFSQRYYSSCKIGEVYRKYPNSKLPVTEITAKRVDRLAALFEGVYTPYMKFHYLSYILTEFASRAECAMPGAKVNYVEVLPVDLLLPFDPKEMYLILSAMLVVILSFDNSIKKLAVTQYESNCHGVITVMSPAVGFAELIEKAYTNKGVIYELCEYGENYLSLAIIAMLCDKNGWDFAVREGEDQTCLYLVMDIPAECPPGIQLMSDNADDTYFVDLLLSPFKERFENMTEKPSD